MNTIIFNGNSTADIAGLLISELPDISRADRRTDNTKIDGRDGDVVSYLGYNTVKKQIVVGLTRGFDIDAIINFFDGEGWAVFSNEPTKRYYVRFEDGFDLERLVRFRKGKINMVAQPFKKLVDEDDVSGTASVTVENLGYVNSQPIITITAAADAELVLTLDSTEMMNIIMPSEGTITIDSEALNCFNSNADKNQYVTGSFIELTKGEHTIAVTGGATALTVKPNSRWL
jgi:phage-related protein